MLEVLLTSGVVSAVVSLGVAYFKFKNDRDRLRREYQLEFSIERALRSLLEDKAWTRRSFRKIQKHLPGIEEQELRRHLIQAGAICFHASDGQEFWGLIERTRGQSGEDS